jgi:hypothetical protein
MVGLIKTDCVHHLLVSNLEHPASLGFASGCVLVVRPDTWHLARRLASFIVTQEGTILPEEAGDIGLKLLAVLSQSSPCFHKDSSKGPGTSVPPDHCVRLSPDFIPECVVE